MPNHLALRHTTSETHIRSATPAHAKKSRKIALRPRTLDSKKNLPVHRALSKPQPIDNKEHMSVYEAERYCALDLSANPYALKTQRHIAAWLARYYKDGGKETPADQWKSETYAALANPSLSKAEVTKKINELNEWNFKRTQSWYALLGWFTSTRLILSRMNRVFDLIGYGLKTKVFAIGGFSYGIELVLDIGVVLKHIFKPDEGEKHLPWYSRVSSALAKDNRWYRILNAAVWFGVNVAAFILSGGTSAILNLLGFTFDPLNELVLSWAELDTNERLLDKFNNKLATLDEKLSSLAKNDFKQYKEFLQQKEKIEKEIADLNIKLQKETKLLARELLFEQLHSLEQDIQIKNRQLSILHRKIKPKDTHHMLQEYIKTRLEISKQTTTLKNLTEQRIYTVCVVLGVLLGMGLFLFPPAGVPAIVGAAIALAVGSVIGGFCRRIYNNRNHIQTFFSNLGKKIKTCFTRQPSPESIPLITPSTPAATHRRNSLSHQKRINRSMSLPAMPTIIEGKKEDEKEEESSVVDIANPSVYSRLSIFAPDSPKSEKPFLSGLTPLASAYTPSVST